MDPLGLEAIAMCLIGLSESGHGGRFEPCEECKRLQAENAELRQESQLLRAENANLSMAHGPGNHTDWMLTRASKYEQLHKDLESLRQDRDRLAAALQKAVKLAFRGIVLIGLHL